MKFSHIKNLILLFASIICGYYFILNTQKIWPFVHVNYQTILNKAEKRSFDLLNIKNNEKLNTSSRFRASPSLAFFASNLNLYDIKRISPLLIEVQVKKKWEKKWASIFFDLNLTPRRIEFFGNKEVASQIISNDLSTKTPLNENLIEPMRLLKKISLNNKKPVQFYTREIEEYSINRKSSGYLLKDKNISGITWELIIHHENNKLNGYTINPKLNSKFLNFFIYEKSISDAYTWIGMIFIGLGVIWAFFLLLNSVSSREITTFSFKFSCFFAFISLTCFLFEYNSYFFSWNPITPYFSAFFKTMAQWILVECYMIFVFFFCLSAGKKLEKNNSIIMPFNTTLLNIKNGILLSLPAGFFCGGILTLICLFLSIYEKGIFLIQPQNFFINVLNATSPILFSLFFFFKISLIEEISYRYFGILAVHHFTKSKILSLLIPSIIFGLTHSNMEFVPPVYPVYGKIIVMTAIGCAWGYITMKYGLWTAIFSHYISDLFIFTRPLAQTSFFAELFPYTIIIVLYIAIVFLTKLKTVKETN